MVDKYGVLGKESERRTYEKAVLEMSPILEDAPYLLVRKHRMKDSVGFHSGSRSASSNSSSPCRASSLELKSQ